MSELHLTLYQPTIHPEEDVKSLVALCSYNPTEERLARILMEYKETKERQLYLGIFEGKIIGCIGCRLLEDAKGIEILHLALNPDFRHRGFATQMIKQLPEQVGCNYVEAQTDNESLGFYKANGFSVENLGEVYPGTFRYKCFKTVENAVH